MSCNNRSKISLCMIVGNVAEYVARCLDSFLPIADEVCMVRAIGDQQPDETIDIARTICVAKGVPFVFAEYKNAPENADWEHIDNFAAARQMSFDLATGDYCFWCDSDDILLKGAENIRRHANNREYACFMFPYDIFGKNVRVDRERMMLKSSGRWQNAVHENFRFFVEPPTVAIDDGVMVQHLPKLEKTGSNERNLRILESIPEKDLTLGLKYHLFGELIGAGRIQEAIPLATAMIQDPEIGKAERYDLLIALTLNTPDLDQRVMLLHEAHKTDPERREALGVLATTMMDKGNAKWALAYARQMIATKAPEVHEWNSRLPFYGWIGSDIYQSAYRVNGQFEAAEIIRREDLKRAGGARISLLHATRGRAMQASKTRKAWHDLAERPEQIEHIFAIDEDDPESAPLRRYNHVIAPKGGGCVQAWNVAAGIATAPVMVQLSDDWVPCPFWDKLILEKFGAYEDVKNLSKPQVLAISDGHRKDRLLCMAICTREYYCQDWFLFHPRFTGVYSDNFFTARAYQRGQVVEAKEIEFKHQHPAFGTAEMDETYARQNAPERYAEGKKIYDELMQGTDWCYVPGFFNYWPFYEEIADKLKDGDKVAEVGVWFGRSLIYLAQACRRMGKPNVRFYAIDNFRGESNQREHEATVAAHGGSIREAFEANLVRCGVRDMVDVIEGDSAASAIHFPDGSLAFCFIDSAHDYESVKRDITAWKPKIKKGGLLSGHDIRWHEVEKAVKELCPGYKQMFEVWVA